MGAHPGDPGAGGELALAAWLGGQRQRILDELVDWLRIPSISAGPEGVGDVARSAAWAAEAMARAGLEHAGVWATAGAPAAYADWLHAGHDAPTVVVYGHHDVQPVEPLDAWTSPPFEPRLEGDLETGALRARGAVDDKGQVAFQLAAVRGLLEVAGALPVNLKVLLEGEEEVGSPHLEDLLVARREELAADAVVVSDTDMWSAEVPSTCLGMRGLVAMEVEVRTAAADLHSGLFGGAVPNPAHHLARLVAGLHDERGRVAVPGFYDDVREPSPAELASLAALDPDEEAWRAMAGVGVLEGEEGRGLLERLWTRPTCEVVGLAAGYGGPGIKTVVPATAVAKVTFRLVPDQDPATVAASFEALVRRQIPAGIDVALTRLGAVAPALTPAHHPGVGAVRRAIERVWGRAPVLTRIGGSGPEEALARVLAAPVLYLGVALPDDGFHAPDERLRLAQLWRGVLAAAELWSELGHLGRDGLRGAAVGAASR